MIEEIIKDLEATNYASFIGNIIILKITKPRSSDKSSYYIEFNMESFDDLKSFHWFKYLNYSFKPNGMVGHIHNIDLLYQIIEDSLKLDKLYLFK